MTIYSQRTNGYQNIKLGFGNGSLWHFGCKVVSFAQGLLRFDIVYTPPQMNQLLKDNNLFTGKTKNLINDAQISKLPFIESFKRIDNFTIHELLELLKTHVVIAEVSPVPIGGTGQHFVAVDSVEGANIIIIDPWFGDRKKVTDRYSNFGNIKSLRVYKVRKQEQPPMNDNRSPHDAKWVEEQLMHLKNEREKNKSLTTQYEDLIRENTQLVKQLDECQSRPPKEIVKKVEVVVEKPVEVIKEVTVPVEQLTISQLLSQLIVKIKIKIKDFFNN